MIIDFHTHVFPDKIATKTITAMSADTHITPYSDGTVTGLQQTMCQDGVSYSVVLPVATSPSQFDSIQKFAADINGQDGIFSFGGIHPDNDHISQRITYIKELGLKGIKLHPDFQNTYIDDIRYIRIIKECIRQDLCCVIHAGMDVGIPIPIHCPPDRAFLMLKEVLSDCSKDSKIILAHIGGHMQWRLVEELLVGENVYFDLAYSIYHIDQSQLVRIIKNHGSHRILFGTDSPWTSQKQSIEFINKLPLSATEKENIFYRNACSLLKI